MEKENGNLTPFIHWMKSSQMNIVIVIYFSRHISMPGSALYIHYELVFCDFSQRLEVAKENHDIF